jgi:methyl-accepting chemotaxis protein
MSDINTLILAALARLEANQDTMRAEMATIRVSLIERTDRLENEVSASHEEMKSLRLSLTEGMERQHKALLSIRDDIGVMMSRADRAHEAADNTRNELRSLGELVDAMGRQITSLQKQVRELRGDP